MLHLILKIAQRNPSLRKDLIRKLSAKRVSRKPGEVWPTKTGFRAMNQKGVAKTFKDKKQANRKIIDEVTDYVRSYKKDFKRPPFNKSLVNKTLDAIEDTYKNEEELYKTPKDKRNGEWKRNLQHLGGHLNALSKSFTDLSGYSDKATSKKMDELVRKYQE